VECVLIADDLTGACDAAAPFAAAGLRTVVPLAAETAAECDVVAFSTESRDIEPEAARQRLCGMARVVRRMAPRILFKKIDSTLRGNTGYEIVAALDTFGCDAAVLTPAFPAMGRIVESGRLRITTDAGFEPVHLAEWLRHHGAIACTHTSPVAIAAAIRGGAKVVTLDATCAADLDTIAEELLDLAGRILWAGSAGLAGALAVRLGAAATPTEMPAANGPVVFCVGSDHPVTLEQLRRLRLARDATVVRTAQEQVVADRPGALFLCGGDTASLVCRALGVERIDLCREFSPGIPIGVLRGGRFDGVTVITKSGGFGDPDILISITDYFHG